jgi:hypothetical protein
VKVVIKTVLANSKNAKDKQVMEQIMLESLEEQYVVYEEIFKLH